MQILLLDIGNSLSQKKKKPLIHKNSVQFKSVYLINILPLTLIEHYLTLFCSDTLISPL